MKTLCSDRFAPTTSCIGFVGLPLQAAAEQLEMWRRDLYPSVSVERLQGAIPQLLPRLLPLVAGRPRELLVEAGREWTAYFDSSQGGTDPISSVGHLCRVAQCAGVAITSRPDVVDRERRQLRYGAVQFQMFGPLPTEFLNYVRGVSAVNSGSRWEFHASGTEQDFEEPERYTARRVRDRFTSDMLERYCMALGIDPFNEDFYGPTAVLVESDVPFPVTGPMPVTFEELQRQLHIEPGLADRLPG